MAPLSLGTVPPKIAPPAPQIAQPSTPTGNSMVMMSPGFPNAATIPAYRLDRSENFTGQVWFSCKCTSKWPRKMPDIFEIHAPNHKSQFQVQDPTT